MGARLVDDMTEKWNAEQYKDTYSDDLMARIEKRIKAGETHLVTPVKEDGEPRRGAEVIDLVSMLRKSLEKKGKSAANDEEVEEARPKRAAARKPSSRLPAKKAQRKRA